LDGVIFCYKHNPYHQARAPRGRIWRKKSEGLELGCIAKQSKEGSGGKVLKLMVAITHGKEVIFCHRYSTMNGSEFEKFVKEHFDDIFRKSGEKRTPHFCKLVFVIKINCLTITMKSLTAVRTKTLHVMKMRNVINLQSYVLMSRPPELKMSG